MSELTVTESVGADGSIHVGADLCPTGLPGRTKMFGIRATAVPAGGTVIFTVSSVVKLQLKCANIPPLQGVNFRVTSLKNADEDLVVSANGVVAGGTITGTGVSGAEFAPWGSCATIIDGQCLNPAVPMIISMVNDSAAAATVQIDFVGATIQ